MPRAKKRREGHKPWIGFISVSRGPSRALAYHILSFSLSHLEAGECLCNTPRLPHQERLPGRVRVCFTFITFRNIVTHRLDTRDKTGFRSRVWAGLDQLSTIKRGSVKSKLDRSTSSEEPSFGHSRRTGLVTLWDNLATTAVCAVHFWDRYVGRLAASLSFRMLFVECRHGFSSR